MMASVIPGFEKTWTISANNAYTTAGTTAEADNCYLLTAIINWMISNGWTFVGSGNGTGGTSSSSSFTWTNSLTTCFLGSAWVQLHNSTIGCYLLVQQNATATNYSFTWTVSASGWTGSISATSPGTAPGDATSAGTAADPFGNATFSAKWHAWKSSDGYVTRIVVYVNSVPVFHFHAEKPTNPIGGTFPGFVIGVIQEGANAFTVNNCLVALWTSVSTYYWRSLNGSFAGSLIYYGSTGSLQTVAAANTYDGNWAILPVGACNSGGFYFWFADLWCIASALQEGCLLPASPPYQVVVVGDLVLPWTNTPMQVV
jgi:hypothetical protein